MSKSKTRGKKVVFDAYAVRVKDPYTAFTILAKLVGYGRIRYSFLKKKNEMICQPGALITPETVALVLGFGGALIRVWYEKGRIIFCSIRRDMKDVCRILAERLERELYGGGKVEVRGRYPSIRVGK